METWIPGGLTFDFTPTGHGATYGKWYEQYSLHLIFTFYLNRDTSVPELFPVVVLKKISLVDPFTCLLAMNRNRLLDCRILVERSEMMFMLIHIIANQNSYHDVITRFVPYWLEICGVVDVLTVPRLSPTGKFRSIYAKMWSKELDIYTHTHTYIYINIYICIYIYIYISPSW